jgi:hypothetical protein
MHRCGSQWTNFPEISYWRSVKKCVNNYLIWLKSGKIVGHKHVEMSIFMIITAVQNILHFGNNVCGNQSCVSAANYNHFVLLAAVCSSTVQKERIVEFS